MSSPLFDIATARDSGKLSIAERFERFDREHPEVYREFCRICAELIRRGHDHYSADGVMHVVRFNTTAGSSDPGEFKVNNNFTALYSRRWLAEHPQHGEFFRTRTRKTA